MNPPKRSYEPPTMTFSPQPSAPPGSPQEVCSICLEPNRLWSYTFPCKCSLKMHVECLSACIQSYGGSCPLCRVKFHSIEMPLANRNAHITINIPDELIQPAAVVVPVSPAVAIRQVQPPQESDSEREKKSLYFLCSFIFFIVLIVIILGRVL